MAFEGVIIEESLADKTVLRNVTIIKTDVEQVTESHKTPWVSQWTLHTIEIPEGDADRVAEGISQSLDTEHNWYADFKNERIHFIIFRDKVFKIDRSKKEEYEAATQYGISVGIPAYQVDFAPNVMHWER